MEKREREREREREGGRERPGAISHHEWQVNIKSID